MNARFGKPDSLVSAPSELTERRFPPPWIVEELEACFYVCDSAGQKLAFVYFEEEPGRRAAAKLLTKDEALRIAANIAKLYQMTRRETPTVFPTIGVFPLFCANKYGPDSRRGQAGVLS